MNVIIALSDNALGEPLTTTRPYGLLPVANTTLIDHLSVFGEATIITATPEQFPGHATCHPEKSKELLASAEAILPSDILFFDKPQGFATVTDGSAETEAASELLQRHELTMKPSIFKGLRVNYPWELLTANQEWLRRSLKEGSEGVVEDGVTKHGVVRIGKGTVIKAGSYIEGPVIIGDRCIIGPQAHLRPDTSIGDDCNIGKTEVVDSIILPHSVSKHHAYIGHSVLGEDVNVGAATITSDYRHDGKNHITLVSGTKVDTKRRKVGAFIGDGCRLGIHTSIYPGRKLWPGTMTLPAEVVLKDKGAD